jgi:hypothetical protein
MLRVNKLVSMDIATQVMAILNDKEQSGAPARASFARLAGPSKNIT